MHHGRTAIELLSRQIIILAMLFTAPFDLFETLGTMGAVAAVMAVEGLMVVAYLRGRERAEFGRKLERLRQSAQT